MCWAREPHIARCEARTSRGSRSMWTTRAAGSSARIWSAWNSLRGSFTPQRGLPSRRAYWRRAWANTVPRLTVGSRASAAASSSPSSVIRASCMRGCVARSRMSASRSAALARLRPAWAEASSRHSGSSPKNIATSGCEPRMSRIRDVPLRGIPPTKIAASRGCPLTAASCGSRRGGVALSAGTGLRACRRNPARAMRRVQMRGGARRQPARRTFCTLSRLSRAPYLRRWALIIALAWRAASGSRDRGARGPTESPRRGRGRWPPPRR